MNGSVVLLVLCLAAATMGVRLEVAAKKLRPAPIGRPAAPLARRSVASEPVATDRRADEPQRWIAVMTVPLAGGAVSVAAALATDAPWLFAGAVALVPAWIAALAYLALSSDTNGPSGHTR